MIRTKIRWFCWCDSFFALFLAALFIYMFSLFFSESFWYGNTTKQYPIISIWFQCGKIVSLFPFGSLIIRPNSCYQTRREVVGKKQHSCECAKNFIRTKLSKIIKLNTNIFLCVCARQLDNNNSNFNTQKTTRKTTTRWEKKSVKPIRENYIDAMNYGFCGENCFCGKKRLNRSIGKFRPNIINKCWHGTATVQLQIRREYGRSKNEVSSKFAGEREKGREN